MANRPLMIKTGHLLPGGEQIGIGATRPVKAIASTAAGEIPVIAKSLSLRQVAVETICAVFGRIAGLPIPEPILLQDENGKWLYGSVYTEHPNFAQYASLSEIAVADELAKWPALSSAACFDEIIANPDRNDENLLYDGAGFFLIDHDMCLPEGMPVNDSSEDYYTNRLLELRAGDCQDDLDSARIIQELCGWAEGIPSDCLKRAQAKSSVVIRHGTLDSLSKFLEQRIDILADLLVNKLQPVAQQRLRFHVEH